MKRLASLSLTVLLTASAAHAQKDSNTANDDVGSIGGIVVKMAGSAPLRKARLVLQSTDDQSRSISTTTDASGRFTLKGIRPGPYRLSVSRLGFVTEEYGQRKPDAQGAILTLRPKQEMKDLVFQLMPAGVISGKILDDDGEPLPSVSVQGLKQVYSEGKRILAGKGRAETNDLGEYRLYGLSPGRYFVSAVYPRWSRIGDQGESASVEKQDEGYAKIYYPGTPEAAKAESITVKPGEEISSIEILMRQVPVRQLRGHVYNQITHKPGVGADLVLIPKGTNPDWDSIGRADVRKDGSFEISEIVPGSYMLAALWFDEGKFYMSRESLEVGNADLEGIALTIVPGVAISGRIVWDGRPSLEKDELSVRPMVVGIPWGFQGQTRVAASNVFTLKDMPEGNYRVEVSGQSKDRYIKEVRYGESSALKDGFTISRGEPSSLEVTISSHGARVQGTVTDVDGLPSAGVTVVLVPELSHRDQFSLYKTESTDQYGHFELRGMAPGEYKLFSWEEVEADAWQVPEFLKPFEDKGERITLQDDDQRKIKITAIRTKSEGEAKP